MSRQQADTPTAPRDLQERIARLSAAKRALVLATLERGERRLAPPLQRRPDRAAGSTPLSFAQERLWFLDRLHPGNAAYSLATALRLDGPLDVDALRRALTELVRRHEALRTNLVPADSGPVSVVRPPAPQWLTCVDVPDRSAPALEWAARRAADEARRPFDLARDRLFRTVLLRLGETEHVLVLTSHHAVADGSVELLLAELAALYRAFAARRPSPLPEPTLQYRDFARWERSPEGRSRLGVDLAYWRGQLGSFSGHVDLPADRRRRPAKPSFCGGTVQAHFSRRLRQRVSALARAQHATPFMVLAAGLFAVLRRYSGEDDLAVGCPVADRSRPELGGMVGCVVNTLVLRVDLSGDPTFGELIARVRHVALDAYEHRQAPFELVVEALRPARDPSRTPVVQVMCGYVAEPVAPPDLGDLRVTPLELDSGTARFDLLLAMRDDGERLSASLDYATDLFDRGTASRLLAHFKRLLTAATERPDQPVSAWPLLTSAERQRVLHRLNDTAGPCPSQTLDELVRDQVERQPDAPAVLTSSRAFTYRELWARSEAVAAALHQHDVRPNTLVGVATRKGFEQLAATIGVLAAGAAYLPLDPELPEQRLRVLLEHGQVGVVATEEALNARLGWLDGLRRVCADTEEAAGHGRAGTARRRRQADLAYVIFTSGSTGVPKGVAIQHRAAVNTIADVNRRFEVGPRDRLLAVSPLSFDLSVYDIFGILAAGGAIVIPDGDRTTDPAHWAELIAQHGVTVWNSVPQLLGLMLEELAERPPARPSSLRLALLSGDWIPVSMPDMLRSLVAGVQVVGLGGATEASIWSVVQPIGTVPRSWSSIPYGRPLTNQRVYVLDERLEPCAVGVPGELYIAGAGLAVGYWRDPVRTSAAFPTHPATGERLYRTGDRARLRPDGTLEFLGRRDDQVKVRGFRVELAEIRAALMSHPAVRDAVVTAPRAQDGERRLVAYVAGHSGAPEVPPLIDYVRDRLPRYMLPTIVGLDALPLTASGKPDRRALPAPGPARNGRDRRSAPAGDGVEASLVRLWEEVLGGSPIGVEDDFFELGGHSLAAARLAARIRAVLGVELPLASLFEATTVRRQAALIRGSTGGAQPQRRDRAHVFTLQPSGHRAGIFLVHPAGGGVSCYMGLARRLRPDRPVHALRAQGLGDGREPLDRVKTMARRYRDEIRALQPAGSYVIGGWSTGAVVAYELAHQLRAAGALVDLLVAIDPADFGPAEGSESFVDVSRDASARVVAATLRAVRRYAPKPYPARAALFSPLTATDHGERTARWERLLTGPLTEHTAPGDHYSMLDDSNVHVLAAQLQACLDDLADD